MDLDDRITVALRERAAATREAGPSLASIRADAAGSPVRLPAGAPRPAGRRALALAVAAAAALVFGAVVVAGREGHPSSRITTGQAPEPPAFGALLGGGARLLDADTSRGVDQPSTSVEVFGAAIGGRAIALFGPHDALQASVDWMPAHYAPTTLGSIAAQSAGPDDGTNGLRLFRWGPAGKRTTVAFRGFSADEARSLAARIVRGASLADVAPAPLVSLFEGTDLNVFNRTPLSSVVAAYQVRGERMYLVFVPDAPDPAAYRWFPPSRQIERIGGHEVTITPNGDGEVATWASGGGTVLLAGPKGTVAGEVGEVRMVSRSAWAHAAAAAADRGGVFATRDDVAGKIHPVPDWGVGRGVAMTESEMVDPRRLPGPAEGYSDMFMWRFGQVVPGSALRCEGTPPVVCRPDA
ncbi:MAG: hypothetical protein JWM89_389 [Acidimicrobiales bacterium]|nr:hypothetical protein [Acidimicrobiales bacterium]